MTALGWSPAALRPLAWVLLHFLWEGTALAAVLAVLMTAFRSARTRYALAVGTLLLMAAAPVATFWYAQHATTDAPLPAALASSISNLAARSASLMNAPREANPAPASSSPVDLYAYFVEAWFAGVIVFSLRAAGGLLLLRRLRGARPVAQGLHATCLELQRRLGINWFVRYCEGVGLDAPAVVGWFRPIVLLPAAALAGLSTDQLEAVIAHELAHIRRLDAFVNLFQVIAESVLFYHPAVWWVNRRIRVEREHCCDDVAVKATGAVTEYARALMLMDEWREAPELAMAANRSPLGTRVARLLGVHHRTPRRLPTVNLATCSVCLAAALLAGSALLSVARGPARVQAAGNMALAARQIEFDPSPVSAARTHLAASIGVGAAARAVVDPVEVARQESAATPASDRQEATQAEPQASAANASPANGQAPRESFIDGMKAVGYTDLSADQLIALRAQGVTPAYVREIKAEGLNPSIDEIVSMKTQGITREYIHNLVAAGIHPTLDNLIAMKVQGITAEYIHNMAAVGITGDADALVGMKVQGITPEYVKAMAAEGLHADADGLVGMKVQGVTPEYIHQMKALGLNANVDGLVGMKVQGITPEYVKSINAEGLHPDADGLVGMKVQGITPEYIHQMRALGLAINADGLVAMKVQGVTPEYVKAMAADGFHPGVDGLVGMKVQGVTPEYIHAMRDLGIKPNADGLIGMKVQGVTPEYIRDMRATGLNPSADDLVSMKVQGVTPEFVRSLQAAGLKNLSADNCVSAKIMGITPEFIEQARSHGFKNLTLDKLIELRHANVF